MPTGVTPSVGFTFLFLDDGGLGNEHRPPLEAVDRLRREGPTAADVQAVKEAEKNSLQEAMRENSYWQGSLQAMHVLGRDPRRILQRAERAESLSQENIHAAIRKYFPAERHTIVTLLPEAQNAKPAPQ